MSEYFPELKPYGRVKVKLDLFSYATKTYFKNVTSVDTSKFAKKIENFSSHYCSYFC